MKTQMLIKGLATIVIAMITFIDSLEANETKNCSNEVKTANILEKVSLEMESKYLLKFDVNSTISVKELNLPAMAVPENSVNENILEEVANKLAEETNLFFDINHTNSIMEEFLNPANSEGDSLENISNKIMEDSNLKFDVNQTISVKDVNNVSSN